MIRSAYAPRPASYEQYQMQPPPQRPMAPAMGQNWPGPASQAMPPAFAHRDLRGNGRQQAQRVPAAPPTNARVVIELNGRVIGERLLNKPVLSIGRLSGNDVQIPSQRVSRLHAKILWENGRWVIEDAESLNGLVYNGNRIDQLALTNGDRIYVAPTAVLQYKTTP
jgi:pSer/pThr/pTyr-binding forkhead associated (FHA) protein